MKVSSIRANWKRIAGRKLGVTMARTIIEDFDWPLFFGFAKSVLPPGTGENVLSRGG